MMNNGTRKTSALNTSHASVMAASLALVAALAQAQSTAPATLTEIEASLRGAAPTGPLAVVVEHDPGLPEHSIYRPRTLDQQHPVVVWGEGGCAANGLMFPDFLSELASHGIVIIADGPPIANGPTGGGPGGPPPGAGAGGGQGAGPAAASAGDAGPFRIEPDGTRLVAAMDWIEAEAANPDSRFHGRVNVAQMAAMGMSCGGLMAYGAAEDPRVATVGVWNSGLLAPDSAIYDTLRGKSVILVTGGESDIAWANSKRDFEAMPASVPVFYGVYPSVGHGGTYYEDNGGAYGEAALAWIRWQLQGDESRHGRGYFVGEQCVACGDERWQLQSRSLE